MRHFVSGSGTVEVAFKRMQLYSGISGLARKTVILQETLSPKAMLPGFGLVMGNLKGGDYTLSSITI